MERERDGQRREDEEDAGEGGGRRCERASEGDERDASSELEERALPGAEERLVDAGERGGCKPNQRRRGGGRRKGRSQLRVEYTVPCPSRLSLPPCLPSVQPPRDPDFSSSPLPRGHQLAARRAQRARAWPASARDRGRWPPPRIRCDVQVVFIRRALPKVHVLRRS